MEHHFLVIAPNVGIVTGQVFAAIWVCMLRTFASSFSRDTLGVDRLNCVEVMLRNLPNNYTRSMLLNLLEKQGFVGRFDFLCLGIRWKIRWKVPWKVAKGLIEKWGLNLHSLIFFDCLRFFGCNELKSFARHSGFMLWQTSRYLPCDFQRKANLGCAHGFVCSWHFAMTWEWSIVDCISVYILYIYIYCT